MNYIGSKYRLLEFLDETITNVIDKVENKKVFCDMFAGTGVVGKYFRKKGYKIISNDIQYYSYILNKANLTNINIDKSLIEYLDNIELTDTGFIYNNYCMGSGSNRNYFTDYNGKKIDAIRKEIENLKISKKIKIDEYYYLLYLLLESADKVANTASVYGAFLKNFKKTAYKNLEFKEIEILKGNKAKVYNLDSNILIKKISGDILYLDPPYNSRQYSSNYHILETIALYDNPEIKGITGLRANSLKSNYCSKIKVKNELDELIKHSNFKYIFLSYNNEGLLSLNEIESIFKKYGKYKRYEKNFYQRFQSDKSENRVIKSKTTTEYLHCLIKETV